MFVTNGDARIDARIDGSSGDAVVLIPGLMLDREIWDAQAAALAKRYRVVRPNLRGTGASNAPEGPYLMENLAADVAAVLDSAGIERASIAGHSLGGYVAIAFARMYAERLERLALVCSHIASDSAEMSKIRYELADEIERRQSVSAAADWIHPRMLRAGDGGEDAAEMAARLWTTMQAADCGGTAAMLRGMAVRDPGTDIAPDVRVPVLVVAGAFDRALPLDAARETARAFPHSTFVVMERSGHVPMLDEPERLAAVLADWMSSAGGSISE